ncbi:uncharacterized protein KY384_000900 [Bacidia gigantensis]|uniref:uncharacterized protein n=1 Tax=Bacidia gigantensis TaxID=2732470 RepID=UPI001D056454|nr:uncharacterized protein KY384_000900 [Bacidia gigantensis]KAG8534057.1 hypothetical protein KY384_000900 [Bacidia gigantensis]
MTKAHLALQAVELAKNKDITNLQQVYTTSNIDAQLVLRIILTYLPESLDPVAYTTFLQDIERDKRRNTSDQDVQITEADQPSIDEARRRLRRLRLLPLALPENPMGDDADPFSSFLVHRAHRIEAATGSLDLIRRLLEPFVEHSRALRTWMVSNLLPLLRLDYSGREQKDHVLSLNMIEQLGDSAVVGSLIPRSLDKVDSSGPNETARDLRGIVGPWMYGESTRKRRKLDHFRTLKPEEATEDPTESGWSHVYEWIVDLASSDFSTTADTLIRWQGPEDVDYGEWGEGIMTPNGGKGYNDRYAEAGLAAIYASREASLGSLEAAHRIIEQVARTTGLEVPLDPRDRPARKVSQDYVHSISQALLLRNALLRIGNPLTHISAEAVAFVSAALASALTLNDLGCRKTIGEVVELAMFASVEGQMTELGRILQEAKARRNDDDSWAACRVNLLWLHDWEIVSNGHSNEPVGLLGRIPILELENSAFRAMLDSGCYNLPMNLYCKKDSPLPSSTVKETIIDAALSAYDAASNGNRTRGGIKKASDIISSFKSYYPASRRFNQIGALLSATHSMSFYSLKLQRGLPFQPVNIRAHKDPMSLIGNILDQNSRSYTHLDDLLEIGQNLVTAGLGATTNNLDEGDQNSPTFDYDKLIARRRVIKMAIDAALNEDDFDTAYSYVVNRLSTVTKPDMESEQHPLLYDDISWRAAYATGSFATSDSGTSAIRRLEQRLEILSQALLLAPPSALAELLGVWQQTEQQMAELLARDAAEEKQAEKEQRHIIPGDFGDDPSPVRQKPRDAARSTMLEEAPMGLFEVARGAAAALSKNAFPLHGSTKSGEQRVRTSKHPTMNFLMLQKGKPQ